jgi:hypothetical protein
VYEHRLQVPISRAAFVRRLLRHGGIAALLLLVSLVIGVIGFCSVGICGAYRLDALLNSAMLLGGMGPVGTFPDTIAAKLFASAFALYAGLVFLVAAALMLTPIFHRVLHRYHCDGEDDAE